jgi:hypothetical protein
MTNSKFIKDFFRGKRTNRSGGMRYYCNLLMDRDTLYSYGTHFPLAVETEDGDYVLNGDVYSSTTSSHQGSTRYYAEHLSKKKFVEIPMSVLEAAEVPVRELKIIASQKAKIRTRKVKDPKTGEDKLVEEHLLGASLVRFLETFYLSSTDRGAHWGFGYFLTQLPIAVKTVPQAFKALKPEVVSRAERNKKDVKRQGEWFFIPFGNTRKLMKFLNKDRLFYQPSLGALMEKQRLLPLVSANGRDPHHRVRDCVEGIGHELFVRGTVRHTGYPPEHKMINLREVWHRAIPNCQVRSWSARGRVD